MAGHGGGGADYETVQGAELSEDLARVPQGLPPGSVGVHPRLGVTPTAPIAVRVGDGNVIEYFSVSGQNAGDIIVLGTDFIGITVLFCLANTWVTVYVAGRFDIAKRTGTTCALGDKIYYDPVTKTVSNSGAYGSVVAGYAARAALVSDTVIRTILWPNFA